MIRGVLAAALLFITSCASTTTRPDALMRGFLDAYNSGDVSRVAAFLGA